MPYKKEIKYLDLKKINFYPAKLSIFKIKNYLNGGSYILEKNVLKFEKKFANFNAAKYCVGVNSGHDALKIALMSNKIGKDDLVIVPSQTFISTWFAVSELGAIPIPCDISLDDGLIDISKLPKKPNNIKALISVNLYGNLCNYPALRKYCKKHNIFLVEDASQSHGALFLKDKKKFNGDIACFSFYPGKNLGSIFDSGAILTNSLSKYKLLKKIRNYGSDKKYFHNIIGMNSRMNGISSIFLLNKLKFLKKEIKIRDTQIKLYLKYLQSPKISFFRIKKEQQSANHIFLILTNYRNKLQKFLKKKNIETVIHYPVIPPKQKFYINKYKRYENNYSQAEKLSKKSLSLPIGSHLNTKDIKLICSYINNFFKKI
jgi:dTDP-4-amino-4,6-dideoxygalactose transaminase